MALVSPGKPARSKSFWADVKTEDSLYDLYTCPPNCSAEVTMIHVVNADGNVSVFVYWDVAAANVPKSLQSVYASGYKSNIIGGKNMSTGEYFNLTGASLVIEPGDKLQVKALGNATPHVDVLCTVTETFIPVG